MRPIEQPRGQLFYSFLVILTLLCLAYLSMADLTLGQASGTLKDEVQGKARYPKHWWEPIPRDETVPEWEILPQDAGEGEVILSKRNELGILSNFAHTPFRYRGKVYESIEGLWQSMKYPEGRKSKRDPRWKLKWDFSRDEVALMHGFEAKDAGDHASANMRKLGISWVSFERERIEYKGAGQDRHYEIIYEATWEKVKQNRKVKDILLQTGDLILRPDHDQGPDPLPSYRYYDIYMKIRKALQER